MKTRYSPNTGAFYPIDINYGDSLPADIIEVPLADYEAAMARPAGHSFAFVDGKLVITPYVPSAAELWGGIQAQARASLDATDMTALRCLKVGVPFPADWQNYCKALRAIVGALTGDPTKPLPVMPAYPAGT